ncbi:hypothetical protein ANN_20234 [Periplaneta americana]|uniref:Uncharacterized protein n=1 Tax=Periplaneta americana TaxID=6978 RepID=A0ABQ8SCA4_PERAM|nr:hypothetical protein ANN_20234 [Periplaneta americana]
MIISPDENIVRNGNIKIGDLSFEEVEKLKYLGATVTNINDTREEIKRRINKPTLPAPVETAAPTYKRSYGNGLAFLGIRQGKASDQTIHITIKRGISSFRKPRSDRLLPPGKARYSILYE